MRDIHVILIMLSFFSRSPPRLLCPSLVHPPQRKEAGQEGARERADLSALPLDTTGEGHHGGVFDLSYLLLFKTRRALFNLLSSAAILEIFYLQKNSFTVIFFFLIKQT